MGLSMHELSDESQQATEQKSPENNGRQHSKWHNTGTQSAFIPKAKKSVTVTTAAATAAATASSVAVQQATSQQRQQQQQQKQRQ